MSKALYRKYRSKSLDEIIGQKHITDILARAISQNSISHAYLLTGPRGVGKTSVARILAHAINNLPYEEESNHLDIIEIDAASNNGVDDVRDLREKVQIAPVSASKKIYIIDEVHMLSKPAFNALLKTLEEPPEHVIFILATTNAEKLPATILSRTQRFSFRPILIEDAVNHLKDIAKKEKIKIEDEALKIIAKRSDGSFRDSISLLDQMSNLVGQDSKQAITTQLVEQTLGLAPLETVDQIIKNIDNHDSKQIVNILNQSINEGVSASVLIDQLIDSIRQQIVDRPDLIDLLDQLITIDRNSNPDLKLLCILYKKAVSNLASKTIALSVKTEEIKAPLTDLAKKVTEDQPSDEIIEIKDKEEPQEGCFDQDKLIDYAKANHVAVYSVLSKCHYQLEDNTLTIYTGNKFYKKKLDDNKYRPVLSQCLASIGQPDLDIHTIATAPPPKDSQAAAIVAIMGGGEEVSLESV